MKKINLSKLLFTSAFLLASQNSLAFTPLKEQKLRYSNGPAPESLDPSLITGIPESRIVDNLFEGLTLLHPTTEAPMAGAAESWTVSPDGKTYTFKIRKDATWSDGKPLKAQDFIYAWTRTLNPVTGSRYAGELYYIVDAEAINTGKEKDFSKLGAKAIDDKTLEVKLNNPTPFFLTLLSHYVYYPQPQHVVEKHNTKWTQAKNIVSNGAYVLTEREINKHLKLTKNPKYWDAKNVAITEALVTPIEINKTGYNFFRSKKIDWFPQTPTDIIPILQKKQKNSKKYVPLVIKPMLGVYFYRVNTTKKPFDDVRVRRALAITINRDVLVNNVTKAGEVPALTLTPRIGNYFYENSTLSPKVTDKEIAEAKNLLAEAGFKDGKGFPKINLLYNTREDHKKIAIKMQSMWKKYLGLQVELENKEWASYLESQRALKYDVSRAGWIGDYPDPYNFLGLFLSNSHSNQTGWKNAEFDKHLELSSKTLDPKERAQHLLNAEKVLMRELPIIPIYFYTTKQLVAEKIKTRLPDGTIAKYNPGTQDKVVLKNLILAK